VLRKDSAGRSAPAHGSPALIPRYVIEWTFKGPRALVPSTPGRQQTRSFGYVRYPYRPPEKARAALGGQIFRPGQRASA
jgi:hypothetical protein